MTEVKELLGIATGCIGMGIKDFERCTPSEFTAIWEAWRRRYEESEHGAWERVRMECLCSMQPYSQEKLTARDIMQFPWEEEEDGDRNLGSPRNPEELEAEKARYERIKKERGLR